jgi:hypothetical protein
MSLTDSSPRRKRARLALAAALVAVGCSGGTGGGCGTSCGGAFRTKDDQGHPIKFNGTRVDNAAQVRLTQSGFNFLNASHLNDIVGALNGESAIVQSFAAPAGTNNLSFWYRVTCPGSLIHGWATATLQDDSAGTSTVVLAQTCTNTGSWVQVSVPLTAAHVYTLVLANHDGNDAAGATYTLYDDVAIGGANNPIKNGGFESGSLGDWVTRGATEISTAAPHSGSYAAQVGSTSPGFTLPCIDAGTLVNACVTSSIGLRVALLAGDTNFNGVCDAADKTPLHINFKDVSWVLDAAHSTLRAHLVLHLKTGDIYVRTKEEHSTLCGGTSAIQLRTFYDDELQGLPQKDTIADLALAFTTTPDGRLEINFDNASLDALVTNFQPAALWIDGNLGTDPATPPSGSYSGNGCDSSASGTYSVAKNATQLNCSQVFTDISAGCDPTQGNGGILCPIVMYIRGYLFDYIKNNFKTQIVSMLRKQLDNRRCQRSTDSQGKAVACDSAHLCPADDDGKPLKCDTARGVCYPPAQSDPPANYNCEPIPLAISGEMDVSRLTEKVGFPPDSKLDVFAGLGSKSGAGSVDATGLQLAAQVGTAPASNILSLCVPPALPGPAVVPPPMDFEASANKPAGVTAYDAGMSLASAMLNRGFLDAYSAGLLCVAVTNKTTAFISSGLFKTFLPSLGLVTGNKDVPMMILLRPTQPPYVRVGRNTTKTNPDGSTSPDDPLVTLSLKQMNLDFYALIDERQVRIFTLQADMQLPLGMRTFADPNADTLQPVLGGLDTLLTNISALSPDGGTYGASDMLAEDPGVVKDLLGAAVRLAQPLLAGVIKPIALPTMLGLRFGIQGVAGAAPMADVVNDGYHHLALWAKVNECGTACAPVTVRTEARVANMFLPDNIKEIREGRRPTLEVALSARNARRAEFSYRVDGSLWSPWIGNISRLTLRDPLFLVPGHHLVEITSREAGDDHTMDPEPVAVDFFVSYESPAASLLQRPDGAVVTRAHSAASKDEALFYSYLIDGEHAWSRPGPPHAFTLDELRGRGLTVSVFDEAGRATQARFGDDG